MSDISTVWNVVQGDYELRGVALRSGDDLATAVVISLFTDRRAASDDVLLDNTRDLRGWWGDGAEVPIGSRLWLLDRSKRTQQTLTLAQDYIAEALQWLIDDGVVARFDIQVEWLPGNQLSAQVTAIRGDNTAQAMQFAWAWNGIN